MDRILYEKIIFEHLITNGEEKLFDTEKSAIDYAIIKHSNESGDMVIDRD